MILSRFITPCVFLFSSSIVHAVEATKILTTKVPAVTNDPVSTSSILQVIVGLVIVLLVIAFGAFMLKRFGHLTNIHSSVLKIIATQAMGPREKIVLVQVGEQQVLVGVSSGRMQTLCELKKLVEIDESVAILQGSFQDKLKSILKKNSNSKDS